VVILPFDQSSDRDASPRVTFESGLSVVLTPLVDKSILWIVITALVRSVGMLNHCARVTHANNVDAASTVPRTRAEFFELKCAEVFMCVVIIECKSYT